MLVLLSELEDRDARVAVEAERGLLRGLNGGCQVPIAGHAEVSGEDVRIVGLVAEEDGSCIFKKTKTAFAHQAEELGVALAHELLDMGAKEILEKLYHTVDN
ncbi:MAG: hydroxymethylbilane synthase, partial [Desulfovibrio sp.]|nr:hydroxymethylbilane synthase [Desulfovibrio sp.]